MEDQFILYEQALMLKKLGFNEDCFGAYTPEGKFGIAYGPTIIIKFTLAPLWQQAFDWFREKYQFSIHIKYSSTASAFCWYIESFDGQIFNNSFQSNLNGYKTYQEARQACLEKLIELVNEK